MLGQAMAAAFHGLDPQSGAVGITAEIVPLWVENECLQVELTARRQREASQRAEPVDLQDLEHQVGWNSSSSGTPSSSDGPRKLSARRRTQRARCRSSKRSAGPPGSQMAGIVTSTIR